MTSSASRERTVLGGRCIGQRQEGVTLDLSAFWSGDFGPGQEPQRGDSIHSESGYLLGVLARGFCVQEYGQDKPSSWVLCPLTGFIGGTHQVTQTRMSQVVTESVLSLSYMGS